MKRYQDRVCIVTGSSDGIGFALAERFAQEGGIAIISSRQKENVDKAVEAIRAQGLRADGFVVHAGNKDHRKAMIDSVVKKYGGIDVLVLNAAVNPYFGPTLDISESAYDKTFDVNVRGAFFMVKECYPHMLGRKGANILFLSSITGYDHDHRVGIYSVTKTVLIALAKTLAKEAIEDDIRVNALAPGLIKTKLTEVIWKNDEDMVLKELNIKRIGTPQDCAGVAALICSDEAAYMTGETVVLAGRVLPRL